MSDNSASSENSGAANRRGGGGGAAGSSSDYSSSDSEEFNDGYDENLMGDEDDRAHLAAMTEKEREEELYNRNEKREVMRTRYDLPLTSPSIMITSTCCYT